MPWDGGRGRCGMGRTESVYRYRVPLPCTVTMYRYRVPLPYTSVRSSDGRPYLWWLIPVVHRHTVSIMFSNIGEFISSTEVCVQHWSVRVMSQRPRDAGKGSGGTANHYSFLLAPPGTPGHIVARVPFRPSGSFVPDQTKGLVQVRFSTVQTEA